MIHFTDTELQAFVSEDVPYLDLSTYMQNIQEKTIVLEIFTRENLLIACSDDAKRIALLYGCEIVQAVAPKTYLQKGDTVLTLKGEYNRVQQVYRSIQVLLEYSSKIATYAYEMKRSIEQVNPHCELLATRKTFPFAKKFCIKAIMTGGAMPHRLGLSESILFFAHHRRVYENEQAFYEALTHIKRKALEKKIIVESASFEDAQALMKCGVDILQIEKASPTLLEKIIAFKNEYHKDVKILATGGIKKENVRDFAITGVDGIVTSALYSCGIADMGSRIID